MESLHKFIAFRYYRVTMYLTNIIGKDLNYSLHTLLQVTKTKNAILTLYNDPKSLRSHWKNSLPSTIIVLCVAKINWREFN